MPNRMPQLTVPRRCGPECAAAYSLHQSARRGGHHGSADQEPQLYERVHAAVGLVGVGADNGYGHPADALLEILAGMATTPERTDKRGLILLSPGEKPGAVTVWTER